MSDKPNFSSLSNKAQGCIVALGIAPDWQSVRAAIISGDLHPNKARSYGWKTHKTVVEWCGLPFLSQRQVYVECPCCTSAIVLPNELLEKEFNRGHDVKAPTPVIVPASNFRKAIEQTINRFSAENGSDTPDFILAQYLVDCLAAYDKAVTAREKWYGREPKPVPPDQAPPRPDVVGKPFLSSI